MVNKVRTINFLPEIFQTESNRQFLNATLDVITSQPQLRRVEGFIGEKYGYGIEPNDKYVVEPSKGRADYQLDPSVIFLKPETQFAQDFINYPGIVDSLKIEGANVSNHDRLFNNQFYSWDPFIDYDKIVNYSQYYWLPFGPDSIPVTNSVVYETGEYAVTQDDNGYVFSDVPGTNPAITLLRGGTYTFAVPAGSSNFWIQTIPGITATSAERLGVSEGVTNNGTNNGTITFVVPDKTTLVNDRLYYQSGSDELSVGSLELVESNSNSFIDIENIIGKKTYTSPNGVKFTNGLKIQFTGNVVPSAYEGKTYYIEGVGSSIVLLDVANYLVPETSGSAVYNYWDLNPWDSDVWDVQLYVSLYPEYITINRNSRDLNAWSRANRWFHQDVINTTIQFLGQVNSQTSTSTTITRAQRPIIEYRGNLKLINSGLKSLGPVNIVSSASDAFSQIEGQQPGNISIDITGGIPLVEGYKLIFVSDTNSLVRQNVYRVNIVPAGPSGVNIVNLVSDAIVNDNDQVFVLQGDYKGTSWYFNDSTLNWINGQRKIDINQYPLFDVFDIQNHSLGDTNYYNATTFSGTKLLSYTPGTGKDDPVLGFPIAYSNPSSIGDILFSVNLNTDQFTYNRSLDNEPVTQNVNVGYVHYYPEPGVFEKLTGYVTAAGPSIENSPTVSGTSFQYQVFEFPEIETLNYSTNNVTINIIDSGSGYTVGDKLKILGTNLGGATPENDMTFTVESVLSTGILTVSNLSGNCVAVNDVFENLDVVSVEGNGSSAIVSVNIEGTGVTTFVCDVPANQNIIWANTIVYYNDEILDENNFILNVTENTTEITVQSLVGVKVTVLVISDYVSKTAYYQTPSNLENNPFNTDITSVSVGDFRNQYRTIFANALGVTGTLFGNNNLHDLGNIDNYGTAIIQNSASLVLPGVFLRKQYASIFNALQFNSDQYQIYKTLLIDLAAATDYSVYQQPSDILDDVIYNISKTKNTTNAFFWSDMVFSGNPYVVNNYTFNTNLSSSTFSLSSEIWSSNLFKEANYNGLAVYLTRVVSNKNTFTQLLKNVDYVVSTETPTLTVNYEILAGDVITVREYNQTYGSYCPSTPSKLGLYPIFQPSIVTEQNNATTIYYIKGHDGSLSRLYGDYNPNIGPDGQLTDFRDIVLYEFEKRVWNNYKVDSPVPLLSDDVIPGQFRNTEYTYDEILSIYSVDFLNWVGANRIDYKTISYRSDNKLTYNYNQTSNKLSDTVLKQGYWRGIYNWFYDTDNPAYAPWEMLGLIEKPDWWDTKYGVAPYTSGNTYMWQDIADGYVWNNGEPYINEKRIRPGLLNVLPVDTVGNMVSPFVSVMGNYNRLTFNRDWVVGDQGPVESGYLNSSVYPFNLMKLLALTKPAKFFNLFVDRDRYKFNTEFGQYLYDNRYHLNPKNIQIYGNGTAKHSYINWVVDYINQRGEDGTNTVTELLHNLDVRLTYRMAGFTAKNYLKFLVEKATPNSKNTSLLIPDESYSVLLYDNQPEEKITYSSVIIQKTNLGYTIWGNSKNKQYFTVLEPKPGYYSNIKANNTTIQVSNEFYSDRNFTIPYGTTYYSAQAVGEFLLAYGQYLTQQGVVFDNIDNSVLYDWTRMIQEFMVWSEQNWIVGSLISLNPNAKTFIVNREGLVVQPLTIQDQNFLLNQNLIPIQSQDACIERENEKFKIKILNDGDTVAYSNLNLYSLEHAIVFDNTTVFNDVIYNLTTGLRQPRLLLKGYKTNEWNGFIDSNGFILNENNIKSWEPNKKYPKNMIVYYKDKYWVARKLIESQAIFSKEDWVESDYSEIKTGLLPNPSTTAYEAEFYYDTNRANLENDVDLLSYSLIGFRPRDYLTAADLSDISQINVYKNIVKSKGTKLLADSFKTASFDRGEIDYSIEENWAIKSGDFGSILNRNFVEAKLSQNLLTGNPTVIGFNNNGQSIEGVQQVIPVTDLINYERAPLTANFLPINNKSYTVERGIPTAGYVNLGDSKYQNYYFSELNLNSSNITNLYRNDNIWVANFDNSWDIFTTVSLNNQIIQADNNLNGTVTITFSKPHQLLKNDLVAIIGFHERINGFYKVKQIVSLNKIIIDLVLDNLVTKLQNTGVGLKLVSRRYEQPSDSSNTYLPYTAWNNRKIWADYGTNNQWIVYGASPVFRQNSTVTTQAPFAISIAYTSSIGQVIADGAGNLYIYNSDTLVDTITASGTGANVKLIAFGTYVYCSSPDENLVYFYELDSITNLLTLVQTINLTGVINLTGAIAVSTDNKWLYVADSVNQEIALYHNDVSGYSYVTTITDPSVPAGSNWGDSLATSVDGVKLIVGAPNQDLGTITDAGSAYIYNKRVQRFYADGITNTFTLANSSPSNKADVYVNDISTTAGVSVTGTTLFFSSTPTAGSVIAVSTGYVEFVTKVQSIYPHIGGLFGVSVDTNRYGAEMLIGVPYELTNIGDMNGVEGAVYRYTNSGQRYGTVTGFFTGSKSGSIFVDGYLVNYSGDIESITNSINNSTPTNIVASYSGYTLTITVLENTPEVLYNILDVTGSASDLADLGITVYTKTQTIYNPDKSTISEFGYNIKMNERDSLVIGATKQTRVNDTTFDYTNNCNQDDTIFDNDTTFFVDSFENDGVAYVFDYLPAHNENIDNPGQYSFGQYVTTSGINENSPQENFGKCLAYSNGVILVGTPSWTDTQGGVAVFNTTWTKEYVCEINKATSWYVDKEPLPIVDINALNNISLYDTNNNNTLEYLDYIDPVNGKILGAVSTNIDYFEMVDPAVYNVNGTSWGIDYVGRTWLNLNTIRLLNYHQPDVSYNAANWGRAFPGSTAEVYTWIESTKTPLTYNGVGFPVYFDKYTAATVLDRATNSLVTKYYFWVSNFTEIPEGKTISPANLSLYLLNPLNSGIAYMAPITSNIVALMNSGDYIQSESSALHIGYGLPFGLDEKHTSWDLIRDNNPEDFLSGLPTTLNTSPTGLYLKFIESFSGFDSQDNIVPTPSLPELVKYGTSFRPNQSMFINRLLALKNYITYANNILINIPIVESRNLEFLFKSGTIFNTRTYWEYVDWWAPGYSSSTKPMMEVSNVSDLQTIVANTLLTGIGGINLFLEDGLIVKVLSNRLGNSEYYVYESQSSSPWIRIGAERSTIQILPSLYSEYGWASEPWGDVWDKNPSREIYWIIRWLNEVCYTAELSIKRNKSLILMFNFIQSESLEQNNYLPWLNKTSLIDVNHRIRSLLPYKKYQRDNQEFLEGFLNEIKPYHVVIKNFIFSYNGEDVYLGDLTDFDLPGEYDPSTGNFVSPQLVYGDAFYYGEYSTNNSIWEQNNYKQWFNNFGLSIDTADYNSTPLTDSPDQVVTTLPVTELAANLLAGQFSASIKNPTSLPPNGTMLIGQEIINYNSVDIINSTVNGLTRGMNGTLDANHSINDVVYLDAPSVIVLNTGRGYNVPPRISAVIDNAEFPGYPREAAEFESTMASDILIGVDVLNTGSGYPETPTLNIENSTINEVFVNLNVNTTTNEITITGHGFVTGDCVKFEGSSGPVGLINNAYYYVRVKDANTIVLYNNYKQAVVLYIGVTQLSSDITSVDTVIPVENPNILSFPSGSILIGEETITYSSINYATNELLGATRGVNAANHYTGDWVQVKNVNVVETDVVSVDGDSVEVDGRIKLISQGSGTLSVCARAIPVTTSRPVREFKITLKFDRISYAAGGWDSIPFDIGPWSPPNSMDGAAGRILAYYNPTLVMPGKNLPQLMNGLRYPNSTFYGQIFTGTVDIDTELTSYPFALPIPSSNYYDVDGGDFLDGYSPEEMISGYISDSMVMTITTDDPTLTWTHTIEVDKYGEMKVFSDSNTQILTTYIDKWWYGAPIDPSANTTLTLNSYSAAVSLRS